MRLAAQLGERAVSVSGRTRCAGTNARGEPCRAPANVVNPATGLCPAHTPGGVERLREFARRGAETTRRRFHGSGGLRDADLPPLDGPRAAATWLERIGRAVATGKLSNRDAVAATKAVREWMRAHEAGQVAEEIDRLRAQVAELKKRRGGGAR